MDKLMERWYFKILLIKNAAVKVQDSNDAQENEIILKHLFETTFEADLN